MLKKQKQKVAVTYIVEALASDQDSPSRLAI